MSMFPSNFVDKHDFAEGAGPKQGADGQLSSNLNEVAEDKLIGTSESGGASSWACTAAASTHERFDEPHTSETAATGVRSHSGSSAEGPRVLEFPQTPGMPRQEPKGPSLPVASTEADVWMQTPIRPHTSSRFRGLWAFLIAGVVAASLAYIMTIGNFPLNLHPATARMPNPNDAQFNAEIRPQGGAIEREAATPLSTISDLKTQRRNGITTDGAAAPPVIPEQDAPLTADTGRRPGSMVVIAGEPPSGGVPPIAPGAVAVPDVQVSSVQLSSVPATQPSNSESHVVETKFTALQPASGRDGAITEPKARDAGNTATSSANLAIGAQSIRQAQQAAVWTYCTVNLIPGGQIAVQKAMSYQACISAGKKCAGTRRYADIQYYDRPTLASKVPLELCYTES